MSDESELEKILAELAGETGKAVFGRFRSGGVPDKFKALFSAKKKRDAERICDGIVITKRELAQLIINVDTIGFAHTPHHVEVTPPGLDVTDEEIEAFKANGIGSLKTKAAQSFSKKMDLKIEKRKFIHGHLIENETDWHLFRFSNTDTMEAMFGKNPHWVGGAHLHYISHLWGCDRELTWSTFVIPPYKIKGHHIRYDTK